MIVRNITHDDDLAAKLYKLHIARPMEATKNNLQKIEKKKQQQQKITTLETNLKQKRQNITTNDDIATSYAEYKFLELLMHVQSKIWT